MIELRSSQISVHRVTLRSLQIGELLRSPPLAEPNSSDGPTASSAAQQEACRFWAKGKCSKGSACPFFHDPKVAEAKAEFREPERLSAVASVSLHLAWALALSPSSSSVKSAVEQADLALRATKERPVAKKSLRETQESQQREQELEVQLLRDWLARGKSSTKGSVATIDFLGRCFVMPVVKAKNQALDAELVSQLEPWGLKRFSLAARKSLRQRFSSCLDATGHLLWKELFGSGKVKLELGAGSGEWVAAQAEMDTESLWVAVELMRDRAHSILRRAIAKELQNLCIFSGDALEMLRRLIPGASISHIFVNFPEPPFVSGNEAAESSFHMMTNELFLEMHRVLEKAGEITILSDNQRYMRSLAETAGGLMEQGLFGSVDVSGTSSETLHGVSLYQGWPNKHSGHLVKSSSYFDSHWAKGKRVDRFYMQLRKKRKKG